MGIVRDLFYARKMSAGLKLPAPTVALLIKRMMLASTMNTGTEKTVSGTLVHITDALARAAKGVLVSIAPIQPGSGDPAPDNVRPISGLTGLSVYRTGKNLFDYNLVDSVNSTETNVRMGYYWTIPGTYTVSGSGSGIVCKKKSADGTYGPANYLPTTFTATIAEGEAIIIFNPTNGASKETTVSLLQSTNVMLEVGSSASTYEPYNGSTYAADWTTQAGTVYGGTVDVVTGLLTVDKVCVNLGDYDWTYDSTYTRFQHTFSNIKNLSARTLPMQCSALEPIFDGRAIGSVPDNAVYSGNLVVNIKYSAAGGNTTAFKTAMNGVQLCYPLGSPYVQTYQLTPQEVQMLLGENYLWSSSGDSLSVTYYAEGNANDRQALNILLGDRYSNPGTPDDVSDEEALDIILGR